MHAVVCDGALGLVADLGGTNARFALVDHAGRIEAIKTYRAAESTSVENVMRRYLQEIGCAQAPAIATLAIAGAVLKDHARFSNLDWSVDAAALRRAFGIQRVELINDFAAQALAVPRLASHDLRNLGPASSTTSGGTIAVIGAGTGFGAAALADGPAGQVPIASEAGHAGFAPTDEVELKLWRRLKARYGRVSVERLLSGPGLLGIYEALCEGSGRGPTTADPADVVAAANQGEFEALRSVERFVRIFGHVAGDLALTFGARGGVFLAGGIAPKIYDWLSTGAFRDAFEDKGRLSPFVREVPTFVVMHPEAGLVGAAARLLQIRERAMAPAANQGSAAARFAPDTVVG